MATAEQLEISSNDLDHLLRVFGVKMTETGSERESLKAALEEFVRRDLHERSALSSDQRDRLNQQRLEESHLAEEKRREDEASALDA